jgi:hypothetical protein
MVIISYTGLDLFLVGELNAKIHSLVSKTLNVTDEEVVFSSYDSFVYYKGHEQTSINLLIKVEMDEKYKPYQEALSKILLESSKEYSVHAFVYFSYYQSENSYSRINEDYPRYLTSENERAEDEYDEENNYDEESLYTGNIFNEFEVENDESPVGFDSLFKK